MARGEYAPIGLLADVLGLASSSVVDRMDQFDSLLSKSCPDLPEDVRKVVMSVMAGARNEWIKSTARLVADAVDAMAQDEEDEGDLPDIRDEEGQG